MDDESKALRGELARIGRGRGARYPKELKARVVSWASREHAAGKTWGTIGEALGIGMETVRRWVVSPPERRARKRDLVPVRMVGEVKETTSSSGSVAVTGWRIEGMSVTDAAALIRTLR